MTAKTAVAPRTARASPSLHLAPARPPERRARVGQLGVAIVLVAVALPRVDETPEPLRDATGTIIYQGFPADVLYEFRLLSLATQLVLWAGIGLVFAAVSGRLLAARTPQASSIGA